MITRAINPRQTSLHALVVGMTLAVAVGLTACAPSLPEPTETPTPTAEAAEPTPTPTPTPTPEAVADFDIDRFREATLDLPDPAALSSALGGLAEEIDACPWMPILEQHTEFSDTIAFFSNPDWEGLFSGPNVRFFYTEANDGSGSGIVPAGLPRNPEGVGVGSTVEEIRAAYPDAVEQVVYAEGPGDMLTFTVTRPGTDSVYIFSSDESHPGVINRLQWGPDAGKMWQYLCFGIQ